MGKTIPQKGNKGNHGEILTTSEVKMLKSYVAGFPSKTSAALQIKIDRNVLDRVLLTGRGSAETIEKVKLALHGPETIAGN